MSSHEYVHYGPVPDEILERRQQEERRAKNRGLLIVLAFSILLVFILVGTSVASNATPVPMGQISRSTVGHVPTLGDLSTASSETSSRLSAIPGQLQSSPAKQEADLFRFLGSLGGLKGASATDARHPINPTVLAVVTCSDGTVTLQGVAPSQGVYTLNRVNGMEFVPAAPAQRVGQTGNMVRIALQHPQPPVAFIVARAPLNAPDDSVQLDKSQIFMISDLPATGCIAQPVVF